MADTQKPLPFPALVVMQAAVSAASLVVEIVAGRLLAPYVGMSIYTWTSIIAVVLAGFSAGHWLGGRIAEAPPARALRLTGWAMAGAALTTAAAILILRWASGPVISAVGQPIGAIVILSSLAFFLPSFFAGVPAPVLAQIAARSDPARSGRALGAIFAAGAVGAIIGTLAAGFLFISWLGSARTLAAVTAVYAVLAVWFLAGSRRAGGSPGSSSGGIAIAAAAVVPLALAGASLGSPDPCTEESDYFCIRVIDVSASADSPVHLMVLDHLAHGISARDLPGVMFTDHAAMLDTLAQARMGKRPFRAFLIGGGTYSLPRSWAGLEPRPAVTVAEIDPMVTKVAADSFWFDPASAEVLPEDARTALRASADRYDVIIGDAFTDIAVPAHLITEEFFRLVASRLSAGGIYLMNVIDHADRLHALASIARTLEAVFPVVEIWTETRAPEPGERLVFILLAGDSPTAQEFFTTRAPDPLRFGRLPPEWRQRLAATREAIVLTDDYAPIDRLIGAAD